MSSSKVISIDSLKIACSSCSLSTLCLSYSLQADDVERLNNIVKRSRPIQRGDMLFQCGDSLRNLYVIKTGTVKIYTQDDTGDEQVVGFHLPGEILGLDAIQYGEHSCYAKALETTAICELPFNELEELSAHIPSLQRQMLRLLSREINEETRLISLLNNGTAEQRLASFLVSLSERFKRRGFSATDFFLSMSRQEIGSYLGLALETVSRLFTRFQDDGILQVERKHVQITDLPRLHSILKKEIECMGSLGQASI